MTGLLLDSRDAMVHPDAGAHERFTQWFRNSRAVDDGGRPLVLYHSTYGDFGAFERTVDLGFHFGTAVAADKRIDESCKGRGKGWEKYDGANIVAAYLSIQNPFHLPSDPIAWSLPHVVKLIGSAISEEAREQALALYEKGLAEARQQATHLCQTGGPGVRRMMQWNGQRKPELIQRVWIALLNEHCAPAFAAIRCALQDAGFDGMTYHNEVEGEGRGRSGRLKNPENITWVAFRANQIKSALANTGAFDPSSPLMDDHPDRTARVNAAIRAMQARQVVSAWRTPSPTRPRASTLATARGLSHSIA